MSEPSSAYRCPAGVILVGVSQCPAVDAAYERGLHDAVMDDAEGAREEAHKCRCDTCAIKYGSPICGKCNKNPRVKTMWIGYDGRASTPATPAASERTCETCGNPKRGSLIGHKEFDEDVCLECRATNRSKWALKEVACQSPVP